MKLYELNKGERFEFVSRHRGKAFEIKQKSQYEITYTDVATGEERTTKSHRKTFRSDVSKLSDDIHLTFSSDEFNLLVDVLHEGYKYACEIGEQSTKGVQINELYKKIKSRR